MTNVAKTDKQKDSEEFCKGCGKPVCLKSKTETVNGKEVDVVGTVITVSEGKGSVSTTQMVYTDPDTGVESTVNVVIDPDTGEVTNALTGEVIDSADLEACNCKEPMKVQIVDADGEPVPDIEVDNEYTCEGGKIILHQITTIDGVAQTPVDIDTGVSCDKNDGEPLEVTDFEIITTQRCIGGSLHNVVAMVDQDGIETQLHDYDVKQPCGDCSSYQLIPNLKVFVDEGNMGFTAVKKWNDTGNTPIGATNPATDHKAMFDALPLDDNGIPTFNTIPDFVGTDVGAGVINNTNDPALVDLAIGTVYICAKKRLLVKSKSGSGRYTAMYRNKVKQFEAQMHPTDPSSPTFRLKAGLTELTIVQLDTSGQFAYDPLEFSDDDGSTWYNYTEADTKNWIKYFSTPPMTKCVTGKVCNGDNKIFDLQGNEILESNIVCGGCKDADYSKDVGGLATSTFKFGDWYEEGDYATGDTTAFEVTVNDQSIGQLTLDYIALQDADPATPKMKSMWYKPVVDMVNSIQGVNMVLVEDQSVTSGEKPTYTINYNGIEPLHIHINKAETVTALTDEGLRNVLYFTFDGKGNTIGEDFSWSDNGSSPFDV